MSKEKIKPSSRPSFRDIQDKIETVRQKRDNLNSKTKEYINSLQEIEIHITETLKTAKDLKKRRDQWNKKVKDLKAKKIEYKNMLKALTEEKNSSQPKKKGSNVFTSLKKIERKIENLERVIETENLDINQENDIIDNIRQLAAEKEELLNEQKSDGTFKLEKKIEIIKINLTRIYDKLNKWSDKSQSNHAKMLELYDEVNTLREKKRKMEEELIENKKNADEHHEEFLKLMNQRKKMNKGKKQPYRSRGNQKPKYKGKSRFENKHDEKLEKIKQDKLASALEKQKAGKKLNIFEARLILEKGK
ncbi:MAG: DUF7121 family protein [Promethearchaeota archaeon]